jgi:replicative DNA helicase
MQPDLNYQVAEEVPYDKETEEALIGSVLYHYKIYPELRDIKPSDFFIQKHQWVWESFESLYNNQIPFDLLTITKELERTGKLEDIGGMAYLISVENQAYTSLHANTYAAKVKECALRRRMLTGANQQAVAAYNRELRTDELLAAVAIQSQDVQNCAPINAMVTAGQAANDMYEILDEVAKSGKPPSIPCGFYDLDKLLQGFYNDTVYIFATRPGCGKSTILFDFARHAAIKRQKHVAIFSLEMSETQVIRRLIGAEWGVSSSNIKSGRLEDGDWSLVTAGLEASQDWPITIDATPGITIETLSARASILYARGLLDMLIIDYIQLVRTVSGWGDRNRNRQQEIGHITRTIKEISKSLHIPIIAAAQVNRMSEQSGDKKLRLSHLREAGDIEQDADCVVFLQPPGEEQPIDNPIQDIEVAKQRDGATGVCQLLNRRKYPRFESIHADEPQDWWSQ